jgi:endonuclease/exonuclease/phosphatase family metal-dependent hydrolase
VEKSIKLLSLNISIFDENNGKLAGFLRKINPDIICLQEVTRKVDDSAINSFISKGVIDKATRELTYSFYAPDWSLNGFRQHNFHGKKLFQHDFGGFIEYGNYVKTRFKIMGGTSIFVQGHFSYMVDWERLEKHPGEEPRMVQVVDLEINKSQKLRVINYHGIWSKDKQGTARTKSANRKLVQLATDVAYPSIICRDFNLFPDTESIKILKDRFISLVDEYGIKTTRPKSNELSAAERNVVDYIFMSAGIEVKRFEVVDSDVSDHLPLLLEFNFK